MSDEIIKQENGLIVKGEQELASVMLFSKKFEALLKVSGQLLKSGMLPSAYKHPEQVAMVVLKGRELGVSELAALQGMYPVGANIGYTVQFILSMMRKHREFGGFDYKFNPSDETPVSCTVIMKRVHSETWIEEKSWTFSQQDAQKAGLIKPDSNYQKWMKNMLLSRAISNCSRVIWSDIFSAPAYLTEELNPDLAIDADIIDETSYQKQPIDVYNAAKTAFDKAKKSLKIDDLGAWYGLFKDDISGLPQNMRGILQREYETAVNKLKPVEVKNVVSGENNSTKSSESSSIVTTSDSKP